MRFLGQTLLVASAIGLSLMVAPACVDNDQSIYIRQVMFPPQQQGEGQGCVYQADQSQPGLFDGVLDLALTDSYQAVLLVGNQMIQRADNLNTRAEPNKAHIDGAVVRVTDADGNDIREFTSPASGFADAANGAVANFGLCSVTLIDTATIAAISSKVRTDNNGVLVLANIKVFGETTGGVDLESGEFQFPIRVCRGCLISFAGADDPLSEGLDCNLQNSTVGGSSSGGGGSNSQTAPCRVGQDSAVSCTLCRGLKVCESAAALAETNP